MGSAKEHAVVGGSSDGGKWTYIPGEWWRGYPLKSDIEKYGPGDLRTRYEIYHLVCGEWIFNRLEYGCTGVFWPELQDRR